MLADSVLSPSFELSVVLSRSTRTLRLLGLLLAALSLISCAAVTAPDPPAAAASPPPAITVTVAAPATSVAAGGTLQFSATVQNATNPTVNWEVNSIPSGNPTVGTISAEGLYVGPTSPPNPPLITVIAVLASNTADFGSAQVTVIAAAPLTFGVFSWRNDTMLSGIDSQEKILTPAAITNGSNTVFGKVAACSVDGEVYAQPLYVPNVSIVAAGVHNVVFVATEHDSVFAFDANASPCQMLWQTSFLNSVQGVTTVPACYMIDGACSDGALANDVGSNDITPEIGITGTPVIDPATKVLYVVVKTKESTPNGPVYMQRLHALDITTGNDEPDSPAAIKATVSGNGAGTNGENQVAFDPLRQNQRAGLALSGGTIYVAFGSHGDVNPFHGWLLAYSETTLAQVAVFNTTPNTTPSQGGIEQGGAAPSIDSSGTIFAVTGLGIFDANSANAPNTEYAQTLLRLSANTTAANFTELETFTPFDEITLTSDNESLGSSGVLLLPNQTSGPAHLATIGGEPGILYLVNRDNLGGFTLSGPDKVLGTLNLNGAIYGTPLFWQGALYTTATGQNLSSYSLSNGILAAAPSTLSPETFAFPAPSPVISANGTSDGIVWVIDASGYGAGGAAVTAAVLHAYDATNLGHELYNSSINSADAAGLAVKFAVPTVANGMVYVGTQGELSVYGPIN